jgi:hypothetical protein
MSIGTVSRGRSPQSGLVAAVATGIASEAVGHDQICPAEPARHTVTAGATTPPAIGFDRDALGRLERRTETSNRESRVHEHGYDLAGRARSAILKPHPQDGSQKP